MNNECRILYIESGISGGGSFQSLYQHLRVINRKYFYPIVIYLNDNCFVEPIQSIGIPVYVCTDWLYSQKVPSYIRRVLSKIMTLVEHYIPRYYIYFVRLMHMPLVTSLANIVHKEKINIIHLNNQTNRDLFGIFLAEKTNVPCISHLRSMRSGGFDKYRANYANQIVTTYIANSNSTMKYWKNLGIDEHKIHVVYNAIDNEINGEIDMRGNWKIESKFAFIIGSVGNLTTGKGHDFLLRTFSKLVKNRSDVILFIAGDGSLKQKLIKMAKEFKVYDRIIFAGYIKNPKRIIAKFDLLILPSQTEAFGRVLLEAMQVGTPIVATEVGGIPEVITNEYNGLLVEYGDEDAMLNAINRLLNDEELRYKLIANGYKIVRERFDIERYSEEIESIYRFVLKTNNF